jgi:hypothetical protein
MPTPIPDEAVVRLLQQTGLVTNEQLAEARTLQVEAQRRGLLMPLGEACVHLSILTEDQKLNLERRYQTELGGALELLGQYRLLKKLGEGGMGAVYLAEDTMMGRRVALKMLPEALAASPELLSRFKREAVAAGKLNHVNIVGAFAFGDEAGKHYYVMEYCEGESLDDLLKRLGRLPERQAVEIVIQVERGLECAHQHGIIHRDIKPANVVLTPEGVAKVLDLGLSKNLGDTSKTSQTMDGIAVGTPDYISPEQARGGRNLDGRADIYALGGTLYHLVTGQAPFTGDSAAVVLVKHITEPLTDPRLLNPDLSDGLVHVILKAMAKAPGERYQNMGEMAADLELVRQGQWPSRAAEDLSPTAALRRPASGKRSGMRAGAAEPATGRSGRTTGHHAPVAAPATGRTGRTTGPQPPVGSPEPARARRGELPAEGSRDSVSDRNRKMLILGGAAGAVFLLLGLILAFSMSGEPKPAPVKKPDPPRPPPQPEKVQPEKVSPPPVSKDPDPKPVVKDTPPEPRKDLPPPPVANTGQTPETKLPLLLMPRGKYYINSDANRTMRFPLKVPPLAAADCELAIGASGMIDDTGDLGMYCKVLDSSDKVLFNQFSGCGDNETVWFKLRVKPNAQYTLIMEDLDTSLVGAHPGNHFSFEVWLRP